MRLAWRSRCWRPARRAPSSTTSTTISRKRRGWCAAGRWKSSSSRSRPSPSVYIFGAGHVGFYLGRLIHEAGFGVHVIDDRAAFANAERFPKAASVVVDDIPQWLARTTIPPTAYVVIVTRGHRNDLDVLREIAPRDLRYIGLIGSRAKVARLYEAVMAEGRHRAGTARAHPCADRPGHRRRDPAGDRGQHRRRADRGAARQSRGAQGRVAAMDAQPQGPSLAEPVVASAARPSSP